MDDPRPRSRSPSPAGTQSPWKSWLSFSIFTFASPDLEELYQAYFSSNNILWTALSLTHGLVGLTVFDLHYFSASPAQASQLPPLWWLGVACTPLYGVMLAIVLLRPAFYRSHRRAFAAAFHLCLALTQHCIRTMLLWDEYVAGPGTFTTWLERTHAFCTENMYLVIMWMPMLALPLGQALELLVLTAALAVNALRNRYICSLPFVKVGLVSLSPGPLAAARMVSGVIIGNLKDGGLQLHVADPMEACPAVLWLWQLVGWWLTCHVVLVAEILWRRAFLRTPSALALVGPAQVADALSWPFCRVKAMESLFIVSFALTCCMYMAWLVTTPARLE